MWDYMFFMEYLIKKFQSGVGDLTKAEWYVLEMVRTKEADQKWLPCFYEYENEEEESDGVQKSDLEELREQLLDKIKGLQIGPTQS